MALEDMHQQAIEASQSSSPQSVRSWKHRTLPTEIVIEILLKLTVESLLRCKSVCKLWYSLISDPFFVTTHLAHRRLIFRIGWTSVLKTCCLNDVMDDNSIKNALEVDYPFKSASETVSIVGSCNGLLFIYMEYKDTMSLWNPSTGKSYTLPPDGGYRRCTVPKHFGLGYDDSTNDYKVVSISFKYNERGKLEMFERMFSLRNGSWKDIGGFPYRMRCDSYGEFLNGAVHWAAWDDDRWTIVSLDLATETYGEVMQPEYDERKKKLRLGTLGEWLCVLCDYRRVRVDLWVMKVYGVKDSWTKLVSVPYKLEPDDISYFLPLYISVDGKILFRCGPKLITYDSKNKSLSVVKNFNDWVHASTFVESLVSPMPPAT